MTGWDDARRASTAEILAWAELQPWAEAMAGCHQDPLWHDEGDVWTHTRMVLSEVERLEDWPSLDRDAQLKENVHLWKMVADENDCFDHPYDFANDHARFLFYRDRLSSLHYTPREEFCCKVTLMSGLPGSGKDTWLAQHRPTLPVVSLDGLRADLDVDATDNQGEVIQAAREACREHLRAGRDFAFNATNTMRQTRKRWIDLFADYGVRIEAVYVEPPLPVIFQQNERRARPVPKQVIHHLVEKLEPPTRAEAHSLTLVQ